MTAPGSSPDHCDRDVAHSLTVDAAGRAFVQDLGRPARGHLGVPVNGAGDQWAAKVANTLVGNAVGTPLIEVTGSSLSFRADAATLVAATGAATELIVNGTSMPTWQPLVLPAGAHVELAAPEHGLRSYVAVSGGLQAEEVLGSVAPDAMLGAGLQLEAGLTLATSVCVCRLEHRVLTHPYWRFDLATPRYFGTHVVEVTPGPEEGEFDEAVLQHTWTVSPQSDHIGLRVSGETPKRRTSSEILSRGVPLGAVEVPPQGGLLVLLRGRLVTAGYPVPAVATTVALDALGQARPGDRLVFRSVSLQHAQEQVRARSRDLQDLADRVVRAFTSSGFGSVVGVGHLGRETDPG